MIMRNDYEAARPPEERSRLIADQSPVSPFPLQVAFKCLICDES